MTNDYNERFGILSSVALSNALVLLNSSAITHSTASQIHEHQIGGQVICCKSGMRYESFEIAVQLVLYTSESHK